MHEHHSGGLPSVTCERGRLCLSGLAATLALAAGLAGFGGWAGTAVADSTTPTTKPNAKDLATEVCEDMVRDAVISATGGPLAAPQAGVWTGKRYTCTYPLTAGQPRRTRRHLRHQEEGAQRLREAAQGDEGRPEARRPRRAGPARQERPGRRREGPLRARRRPVEAPPEAQQGEHRARRGRGGPELLGRYRRRVNSVLAQRGRRHAASVLADRRGVVSGRCSPRLADRPGGRGCAPPLGSGDFAELVGLDEVALLEVVVVLEPDAALEAALHLTDVVLEALERRDRPVPDDDALPEEAHLANRG